MFKKREQINKKDNIIIIFFIYPYFKLKNNIVIKNIKKTLTILKKNIKSVSLNQIDIFLRSSAVE